MCNEQSILKYNCGNAEVKTQKLQQRPKSVGWNPFNIQKIHSQTNIIIYEQIFKSDIFCENITIFFVEKKKGRFEVRFSGKMRDVLGAVGDSIDIAEASGYTKVNQKQ